MQYGHKILACLPVRTDNTSEESHSEDFEGMLSESIKKSKILLPINLHILVDDVLQSLAEAALVGTHLQTRDQKRLRMHIVLGSYPCDNLGSEDLLGVKRAD